jgi:hypothetical protein
MKLFPFSTYIKEKSRYCPRRIHYGTNQRARAEKMLSKDYEYRPPGKHGSKHRLVSVIISMVHTAQVRSRFAGCARSDKAQAAYILIGAAPRSGAAPHCYKLAIFAEGGTRVHRRQGAARLNGAQLRKACWLVCSARWTQIAIRRRVIRAAGPRAPKRMSSALRVTYRILDRTDHRTREQRRPMVFGWSRQRRQRRHRRSPLVVY